MTYCGIYNIECKHFGVLNKTMNFKYDEHLPIRPIEYNDICRAHYKCQFQKIAETDEEALDAYYRSRKLHLLQQVKDAQYYK